jgi:RNA polymerase sigma-70 factor (ECF subfamily)
VATESAGEGIPGQTLPSDGDLVRRAQAGEREAFGVLVRRYQRRVFSLGIRMLRNRSDAEDLVQETFLRAFRALDRFEPDRPLAPWLYRIATNRALSSLERRGRRNHEELSPSLAAAGPNPEEETDKRRLERAVRAAVAELPPEQRAILALRVGEELSYREIAEVVDVPIGTVMSRLARARETLRRKVRR